MVAIVLSTKLKKSIKDLDTAISVFFGVYCRRQVKFNGSLIDFHLFSTSNPGEPIGDLGTYGTVRLRRLDDKLTRFEIFESSYPPDEKLVFDYVVMREIIDQEISEYKVRLVKLDYFGYLLACTLAQWEKFLGKELCNLTMDHIIGSAHLSESVLKGLERKSISMGVSKEKLLELLKKSWATEYFVKKEWKQLKLIWGNAIHEGRKEYLNRAKVQLINSLKNDGLWELGEEFIEIEKGEVNLTNLSTTQFKSGERLSKVEQLNNEKKARNLPKREPYRTRWINIWRLVEVKARHGVGFQEMYAWLSSNHYEMAQVCSLDTFRDIVICGLAERIPTDNSQ